jgi:penicillin-binding protein activator
MFKQLLVIIISFVCILCFQGCGSSRSVSRVSADSETNLSGKWNETDARLVAEQMITSLTSKPWLSDFVQQNSKKPTVIVGTVRNMSSEHIETEIFVKDIQRELVNSGKVSFVANNKERQEVRQERLDQQSNAMEESAKKLAAEAGADFMLRGSIKDIVDAIEGKQTRYYQVDLELINVETNETVWLDSKKIKKVIEKSSSGW